MPQDPDDRDVSGTTRRTEKEDEALPAAADREPTPEEEAAAEGLPPVDEKVAENYRHQSKVGAEIEGEGQIG